MPDRAAVRPGRRRRRSAIPSRRCFTIVDLMMDGSPLFVSLERGGASFLLFIRRAYQQLCNTLERLTAQPEPSSLAQLKQRISQRYGMLDLLDVFVEAERLVGFTHCFTHSGTTEVRSRAALQPLL